MSVFIATASLSAFLAAGWPAMPPAPPEPAAALLDLLDAYQPPKLGSVAGRIEQPTIEAIICRQPWPSCAQAVAIARCESTLNPRAISPGGHRGLFQLDPRFHAWRVGGDPERLLNAADNAAAAYGLWRDSGGSWRPWSCQP